jgi:hypothetical protein
MPNLLQEDPLWGLPAKCFGGPVSLAVKRIRSPHQCNSCKPKTQTEIFGKSKQSIIKYTKLRFLYQRLLKFITLFNMRSNSILDS